MASGGLSILHLTPFKQSISGSDESLIDLIKGLTAQGFTSIVALPKESPYGAAYSSAGAHIVYAPVTSIRRSLNPLYWAGFSAGMWYSTYALGRMISTYQIQIVHTNMETALAGTLAAHAAKIPNITHVRSTSISRPTFIFKSLIKFWEKTSDAVVAISDAVRNLLIDGGMSPKKVHKIYDPVDVNKFKPVAGEERKKLFSEKLAPLGIKPDCKLVVLVARMNPIKGQSVFLDSARILADRHKELNFVFIGDSANAAEMRYELEIKLKAKKLGIASRTRFLGYRKDIHELLPLFDVCVCPSTTEAFGRPAAEAMACAVPVVASAIDGLKEIVADGETGFVVPPAEPVSLAEAIEKIISDEKRAALMGQSGRKRVIENFSAAIHVEKMKALFEIFAG